MCYANTWHPIKQESPISRHDQCCMREALWLFWYGLRVESLRQLYPQSPQTCADCNAHQELARQQTHDLNPAACHCRTKLLLLSSRPTERGANFQSPHPYETQSVSTQQPESGSKLSPRIEEGVAGAAEVRRRVEKGPVSSHAPSGTHSLQALAGVGRLDQVLGHAAGVGQEHALDVGSGPGEASCHATCTHSQA